jgi:outer membrane receptor for ferric coprogen and ferric-rhodotorulic acid
VNSWLAPYVSFADSYLVPPDLQNDPYGNRLPVAHGMSAEAGLKIATPDERLSGQVAVYQSVARNQEYLMATQLENDINPVGLNGAFDSDSTNGYGADTVSDGVQVTLTAVPAPNWRARLSAAFTGGRIESTRIYNVLYNDQFYENGAGQVTYADGTPVYVPAAFNAQKPTVPVGTPGAAPLTVTMMSTPGTAYYASPLPVSGAIAASSNVAKVLEAADPVHGAILTGATGLPLSSYQLNPALTGVTPQTRVPVAVSGEATTGYPEWAFNLTNLYTVPRGWLKGVEVGGSVIAGWRARMFYYYPAGLTPGSLNSGRALFSQPAQWVFNPILGYEHKFDRFTFSSQLNIYNLFNHYEVTVFPDYVSGWTNPSLLNANFFGQPRSYVWTNTISF